MSAQSDLVARLKADGGVTALVGSRIYPAPRPVNVQKPVITYRRITSVGTLEIDGGVSHYSNRIQINCWDDSYKTANDLSDAVKAALSGYGYIPLITEIYDDVVNEHGVALDWSRFSL